MLFCVGCALFGISGCVQGAVPVSHQVKVPGKVVGQRLQLWHGSGLLLAAREGILMALCRDRMNVHDNATPCPGSECKMSCLCCCWLLHTLATSAGWPLLQVFEERTHG